MSVFAWLDYSETERRKMMDVIDLFREKNTVDELGLGTIRDALADRLFPGTSTIMTRARYYLLVPWTYRALEAREVPAAKFATSARRAEIALIEAIEQSDDKKENIGRRARERLKRPPSNVYWAGLRTWGIRRRQLSQADYHRGVDGQYRRSRQRLGRREARDVEHDDISRGIWDEGMPSAPPDFPEACSLRLRREDAAYLAQCLRTSPGTRESLLAELMHRRATWDERDHIWFHPEMKSWREDLQEVTRHARMFSEVMQGASLLYNHELMRLMNKESPFEEELDQWAGLMKSRRAEVERWDLRRFWELVRMQNPRLGTGAVQFTETWHGLVKDGGAARVKNSAAARDLIVKRELWLKRGLARLSNPAARERWNESSGAVAMDFRWGRTQVLLNDIFSGLGRVDRGEKGGMDAAA